MTLKKFLLRGLAEGLAGRSFILATDMNDVLVKIPVLLNFKSKLSLQGDTITGFWPCDG